MPTVLPRWAAEAALYPRSPYSYGTLSHAFPAARPVPAAALASRLRPLVLPCGTCGPCVPDGTGCSQTCWTPRGIGGTCDQYDKPCRGPGCTPPPRCPSGQTLCGSQCVDLTSDPAHCGNCSNACPSGSACCNGVCCGQFDACCGGKCCPSGDLCCVDECGVMCPDGNHCCPTSQGYCSKDSICCCPAPGMSCVVTPLGNLCIP